MDRNTKHPADRLFDVQPRHESHKAGGMPTNLETTIAGTWPPMVGHSSADDLRQVAALDTVVTSLTALCHHGARSMRSGAAVPGSSSHGRADSQGRMDLMTILAKKAKDFVNAAAVRERQLIDAMWHPRS